MVCKFLVYKSEFNHWPARDGRPASDEHSLLVLDMSEPAQHRLTNMLKLRLESDQVGTYFEKVDGKSIDVAVFSMYGKGQVSVRGKIIGLSNNGKI